MDFLILILVVFCNAKRLRKERLSSNVIEELWLIFLCIVLAVLENVNYHWFRGTSHWLITYRTLGRASLWIYFLYYNERGVRSITKQATFSHNYLIKAQVFTRFVLPFAICASVVLQFSIAYQNEWNNAKVTYSNKSYIKTLYCIITFFFL